MDGRERSSFHTLQDDTWAMGGSPPVDALPPQFGRSASLNAGVVGSVVGLMWVSRAVGLLRAWVHRPGAIGAVEFLSASSEGTVTAMEARVSRAFELRRGWMAASGVLSTSWWCACLLAGRRVQPDTTRILPLWLCRTGINC